LLLQTVRYTALLASVYVLVSCSSEEPAQKPVRSSQKTEAHAETRATERSFLIVAFGDSLYAGYGVQPRESFPARLQTALEKNKIAATVTNAGVSGDTTASGLQRLKFTLEGLPRKPDLMIVGLGANDMLRGLSPVQTRANLIAICDELKQRDIPILLTGMVAAPNMGKDYAQAFNAIYADLARRYDSALYPFFLDGVVTKPDLLLPDQMHPNSKGIDIITRKVLPTVINQLNMQKADIQPH